MRKIISIIIIIFFSINGFVTASINYNHKEININNLDKNFEDYTVDYTHTVLVEVGTASWCPSCPDSNIAWHNIYEEKNYNFEYCEMVVDKNVIASSRMDDFNLYWVPTSYFDAGEFVFPGTNINNFYEYLDLSGTREVWDLFAELNVRWMGNSKLEFNINITNNESLDYNGYLRVYIIELESSLWRDYRGNPYYHAFLDFSFNKEINIPAKNTFSNNTIWDGITAGYANISEDNIQVILSVFNSESNPSYSDPPNKAPFLAFYADETISTTDFGNSRPLNPIIEGPINGKKGERYEYTIYSIDPNGDNVTYCIDWGDDTGEKCFGPFKSGEEILIDHIWDNRGTYLIKLKSRDEFGAESDWVTLEVSMPKLYSINYLQKLINKYPQISRFIID
jgi:thiol-disulfide isomerase/thioredoxin